MPKISTNETMFALCIIVYWCWKFLQHRWELHKFISMLLVCLFAVDGLYDQRQHGQWSDRISNWGCHQQDLCLCKISDKSFIGLTFMPEVLIVPHNARLTVHDGLLHQLLWQPGWLLDKHSSVQLIYFVCMVIINDSLLKLEEHSTSYIIFMMFLFLRKTEESVWQMEEVDVSRRVFAELRWNLIVCLARAKAHMHLCVFF